VGVLVGIAGLADVGQQLEDGGLAHAGHAAHGVDGHALYQRPNYRNPLGRRQLVHVHNYA